MKAGLLRNTNAQHGTKKKSVILNVRVTGSEKELWQSQARNERISLSLWVESVLNNYCKKVETK